MAARLPAPDAPISYLELGCGQGFGALLLAASNPTWQVTAVDFNPAHIAEARRTAAAAGWTTSVSLRPTWPPWPKIRSGAIYRTADFVRLHGVWSWVPAAVQAGIVRLLGEKLRPGGVHVSYNALPGWQGALGMQRLLREAGSGPPGIAAVRWPPDELVRALSAAERRSCTTAVSSSCWPNTPSGRSRPISRTNT